MIQVDYQSHYSIESLAITQITHILEQQIDNAE